MTEWFDMRKFEMGINYLLEGETVQLDKKYKIIEIGKGDKIGRIILRRWWRKYLWIPNQNTLKRLTKR